jgi:hypothetical protein
MALQSTAEKVKHVTTSDPPQAAEARGCLTRVREPMMRVDQPFPQRLRRLDKRPCGCCRQLWMAMSPGSVATAHRPTISAEACHARRT